MHMVGDTANAVALTPGIPNYGGKVSVQIRPNDLLQKRLAGLGAERDMYQQKRERLRHSAEYRSGLQPSGLVSTYTRGVAPRWYITAPSALGSVLATSLLLTGCHTTQPATPAPTHLPAALYPARPTVPAPMFKVFHKTDTSLTLTTDPDATDEEIESLVWQLRDAAHAHTLAKVGIDQAYVDHNKPSTWFHIYRGTKCAAEKYVTGNPPCGGSYHAAADYTFGTVGNPMWDQGTLLHDEKETLLWDPDKPYTATH